MTCCDGTSAPTTGTPGCGCSDSAEDLPVNPFVDLRVSYGMLLGAEEFRVLMGNPRGKLMLHNAWLHGSGVVWGYSVTCSDDRTLAVGPGLALDGVGRELLHRATECLDLYRAAADLVEGGRPQHGREDCRSWTVHACLVAEFDTCLTAAVPTVQDPCDVTRAHDAYSRVVERVRFELREGCCPRGCCGYHRVRVLLGLEAVGDDDAAGESARAARARVLRQPVAGRTAALLGAVREMAALDAAERRPHSDPGPCEVGVFPVDEEDSGVPLACVRLRVVERDGCPVIEEVCVDTSVRTTLLPTCVVQDLAAAVAPGLGGEDAGAACGPQLVTEDVAVEGEGRRLVLPVTDPLLAPSVPGGVRVHTLSTRDTRGWQRQALEDVRYEPDRQAIVVRLVDALCDDLVRVVVAGTGDRPVMGADPIAPLAGIVGDPPPATAYDGRDAVLTIETGFGGEPTAPAQQEDGDGAEVAR